MDRSPSATKAKNIDNQCVDVCATVFLADFLAVEGIIT